MKEALPPSSFAKESIGESIQALLHKHQLVPPPLPEHLRDRSKAELRREVKRLQNLRAAEFAARVAGPGQDSRLREGVRLATKIGTEQARLRELRRTSRYGSSAMIAGGAVMAIDDQLAVLEQLREEAAARVRQLKQRIREECDAHPEFGLLAEERVSAAVERAPEVRPVSKGRVRRRVEEIRRSEAEQEADLAPRRSFLLNGALHPVEPSDPIEADSGPPNVLSFSSAGDVAQLLSSVDEIFSEMRPQSHREDPAAKHLAIPGVVHEEVVSKETATRSGSFWAGSEGDVPSTSSPERLDVALSNGPAGMVEDGGGAAKIVAADGSAKLESGDDHNGSMEPHSEEGSEEVASAGRTVSHDGAGTDHRSFVGEESVGLHYDGSDASATGDECTANDATSPNIGTLDDTEDGDFSERPTGDAGYICYAEPLPLKGYRVALQLEDEDSESPGDDSGSDDSDEREQIHALREHARVLQGIGDVDAADKVLLRALEVDPLDVHTLCDYAIFLHRRRGELARAESFFRRWLS